ncbi:hypothetical protein C2I18_18355 [Paenibacillus sp. PK3_47]|uniref:hypothetical protein n=1 Tax=Paenibacillus sp. PK3_47 TaxID=2072642 RepID=UPI00201D9765|nr:hypothetical protein [Paenibacillus sp. PK3_47]UQZ35312.1 hypothetical protein C2I18_18355 [Paenibacillus sp. PK3_47]
MFHPTVFENIKVSLENQIYDYDNLDGLLTVTDRYDRLDLALMSREFGLSFQLYGAAKVTSELVLRSSVKDLGDEILETPGSNPGCSLLLRFYLDITEPSEQCKAVKNVLSAIWGSDLTPVQTLSFIYGAEDSVYSNIIELQFNRQINEEQMEDLPDLLKFLLQSAEELEKI